MEDTALRRALSFVAGQPRARVLVVALLLVACGSALDYATGPELGPLIFYVVPVALVAWAARRRDAFFVSFVAAGSWLVLEATRGRDYSAGWILAWNTLTRLAVFLLVAVLLASLRRRRWMEEQLARAEEGTPRTECPYCGSTDTVRLLRSLICRSCQRGVSLTDLPHA